MNNSEMTQLELKTSTEVDIDGYIDSCGVQYFGKALLMGNGSYRCLAEVNGNLCIVECKIREKKT